MTKREEVLFSSEEQRSVGEIGDFLIQVGEKLKEKGSFTLLQGEKQLEVHPAGRTKLELKYEIENGMKHSFEIEIEWKPGEDAPGKVNIT